MAALRILVPVKRVIDYAVGLPFQFNDLFRVRTLPSRLGMELGSWNGSWRRGRRYREELGKEEED